MEHLGLLPHSECPPPTPILSQLDQVHNPISHFLKIHIYIILPSMPGSPSSLFPSGFPTKNLYMPLPSPIHATCRVNLILLDFITWKILGEEYRTLSSSLCIFVHSLVTVFLLGLNILLNTLFSDTFSLHSSFNVSDQVSHPCKATGKIIVLYILIFKFWIANWKTKDSETNNSQHSLTSICS